MVRRWCWIKSIKKNNPGLLLTKKILLDDGAWSGHVSWARRPGQPYCHRPEKEAEAPNETAISYPGVEKIN
jgi:hypothetical protein